MLISTEIASAAHHVGEEKAVELVARAGFDAWDLSMFAMCRYDRVNRCLTPNDHPLAGPGYLAFVRQLRRIGQDGGIHCNQSHAPFPTSHPDIRGYMERALECTAEAGAKICVIHPGNRLSARENGDFFRSLLPTAKAYGVKIATENMWNWEKGAPLSCFAACSTAESFAEHIDEVADPYLVACLDLGHAEMRGSGSGAANMIRALGPRLQALHIHDNDLREDLHQVPFTMQIDFGPIVEALREVGYSGYLTLEASDYLPALTAGEVPQGLRFMADAARRLRDMF